MRYTMNADDRHYPEHHGDDEDDLRVVETARKESEAEWVSFPNVLTSGSVTAIPNIITMDTRWITGSPRKKA